MIDLKALPQGPHTRPVAADASFFEQMERTGILAGTAVGAFTIEPRNGAWYCNLTLEGEVLIPCDRCLEPMPWPVDICQDFRLVEAGPDADLPDGTLPVDASLTFDLGDMMADSVLLSIPMRHVHAPGGCNPAMEELLGRHLAYETDGTGAGGTTDIETTENE